MLTERPLGYRQLEAGTADMVEATAVYASILVPVAVTVASPTAIDHALFNLHSEKSLGSTKLMMMKVLAMSTVFHAANLLKCEL